MAEPVAEPESEPAVEPAAEPESEPVVEPESETPLEPATETTAPGAAVIPVIPLPSPVPVAEVPNLTAPSLADVVPEVEADTPETGGCMCVCELGSGRGGGAPRRELRASRGALGSGWGCIYCFDMTARRSHRERAALTHLLPPPDAPFTNRGPGGHRPGGDRPWARERARPRHGVPARERCVRLCRAGESRGHGAWTGTVPSTDTGPWGCWPVSIAERGIMRALGDQDAPCLAHGPQTQPPLMHRRGAGG